MTKEEKPVTEKEKVTLSWDPVAVSDVRTILERRYGVISKDGVCLFLEELAGEGLMLRRVMRA